MGHLHGEISTLNYAASNNLLLQAGFTNFWQHNHLASLDSVIIGVQGIEKAYYISIKLSDSACYDLEVEQVASGLFSKFVSGMMAPDSI